MNELRLQLIFDKLSVADLIFLGQINDDFWNLVEGELRIRFSKKLVKLHGLPYNFIGESVIESEEQILIRDAQNATFILEKLGTSIQSLWITTSLISHEPEVIFALIEKHCSETLIQLELFNLLHNFFQNLSTPFKNVITVNLKGIIGALGNDQFTFSTLFPAMRFLELDKVEVDDHTKFALELPNLRHLSVYNDFNSVHVIRKNPQIRSIFLYSADSAYLEFVANNLLGLEELTLYNYHQQNDRNYNFRFDNVKFFECALCYAWPKNIRLSNLELLHVLTNSQDINYIDFIEESSTLRELQITGDGILDANVLTRIIIAKLNITEMNLVLQWYPEAELIIQLVENYKQLNKLDLMIRADDIDDLAMDLQSYFGPERVVNNVWSPDIDFNCIRILKSSRLPIFERKRKLSEMSGEI